MFLTAIFLLSFVTALIGAGATLWLFDRLLHLQRERYPTEWARDGAPMGFFWVPAGARLVRGSFARSAAFLRWTFRTPAWVRQDERAKRLLRDLRLAHVAGLYGILMTVLAVGLALSLGA
jgi:hypothetical protein